MEYSKDPKVTAPAGDTVVTLGKFDGVHRGHNKLLTRVKEIAAERNLIPAVFTFDVSPQVKMGSKPNRMLMTNAERNGSLQEHGIEFLMEYPFTPQLREMSATDFLEKILLEGMHAKAIVVGNDFHFGKNRQGSPEFLLEAQKKYGIYVEVHEKEMDGNREISSTYVREELKQGHMEKTTELLGFPFYIKGEIVHGANMGHSLGFATLNQIPSDTKLLPPMGVYFSRATIDGEVFDSITNIGEKPTVAGGQIGVETHLFHCDKMLYGKEAKVELLVFERPEIRFDSIEELVVQVQKDIRLATQYHAEQKGVQ